MIYRIQPYRAAIQWEDDLIYCLVVKPTEYERCLVEAVNSLPTICRKTVILFTLEQLTRESIATLLEMSFKGVCFLIHRAGLLMREYLNSHGHPSVPSATLDMFFKGWPYLELGQLVKLRQRIDLKDGLIGFMIQFLCYINACNSSNRKKHIAM